jgi:homoprotocatechuate degradation regulator HpaR
MFKIIGPDFESSADMTRRLRGIDQALPIALLRAREATMRRFKPHVDSLGLTMPQWRVIRALAENDTLPASDLAEKCVVLPSSMTRILNSLIENGWVEPAHDDDGRKRSVRLTQAGTAIYSQMADKSEAIYRAIEQRFSTQKMADLLDLLDQLKTAADGLESSSLPPLDVTRKM